MTQFRPSYASSQGFKQVTLTHMRYTFIFQRKLRFREYWMIYRGPGFSHCRRIWLLSCTPCPPLPSVSCLSFSVFLCDAGRAYWEERLEGGGGGAKSSYDCETWSSINNSVLSFDWYFQRLPSRNKSTFFNNCMIIRFQCKKMFFKRFVWQSLAIFWSALTETLQYHR
jgi:hypothetical protein